MASWKRKRVEKLTNFGGRTRKSVLQFCRQLDCVVVFIFLPRWKWRPKNRKESLFVISCEEGFRGFHVTGVRWLKVVVLLRHFLLLSSATETRRRTWTSFSKHAITPFFFFFFFSLHPSSIPSCVYGSIINETSPPVLNQLKWQRLGFW